MKKLIPNFIHKKYSQNEQQGKFEAFTMFMDMSGFTALSETLMQKGKDGAEVLSSIINDIFTPIIEFVYNHGGFISDFAGDAFTAIFPNIEEPEQILHSANEIINFFKETGLRKTVLGEFKLETRIGLSFGEVSWGIVGNDKHKLYYFKGTAIDACADGEHHCRKMNISLDKKILKVLPKSLIEYECTDEGYCKLNKIKAKNELSKKTETVDILSSEILSQFLPQKIINFSKLGELRDTVCLFISFNEISTHEEIREFAIDILRDVYKLGAYTRGLGFGDKGSTLLVLFGAPVRYENDVERALNFSMEIKSKYKEKIRAGITCGPVFAGIIGSKKRCTYDVLGDTVNVAARLMMKANWGDIWVSEAIQKKAKNKFSINSIGEMNLKGKSKTTKVFELSDTKLTAREKIYQGDMVGREKEIEILTKRIDDITQKKFGGCVYIYGEAGIGKSRFIYEASQRYKNTCMICVLQCDSIIKNSLNPIVYFLKEFFEQENLITEKEKEFRFLKVFKNLMQQIKDSKDKRAEDILDELKRTQSLIRALLDLDTKGSLYEELEPKLRFENTISAIKNLFKALSLIQPLIIQLEDIHWIDNDSITVIQALNQNVDDFPFIIIATSRYGDDGSKPNLKLKDLNDSKIFEIEFETLKSESVDSIVTTCLGKKADKKLTSFIIERTQNNPFYIGQFCLYLLENRFIEIKDDVYSLNTEIKGIPQEIKSILVARIDRLPTELKEFTHIAAVLGREFDIKVLNKIIIILNNLIKSENSKVKNYFDTIAISSILNNKKVGALLYNGKKESLWNELTGLKYIFKHALLVQAAYNMQLKKRLIEIHKIAGVAIEQLYKDEHSHYIDIAHHYEQADIIDKTTEYLEKAGDYFKKEYRNDEAIAAYDKLLKLNIDKSSKIDIIYKKSEILNLIGRWDEAINLLEHELSVIEETDLTNRAKINLSLGTMLYNKGEYEKAMKLCAQIKKITEESNNKIIYAQSLAITGKIYKQKGDYEQAMIYFLENKRLCDELQDKSAYAHALGNIGIIYRARGDYKNAMKCYNEEKELCLDLGDKIGYANSVYNIGDLYWERRDYDKAMKYCEQHKKMCSELGDKIGYSINLGTMGIIYEDKGDYDNAMNCYEELKKVSIELGDKSGYASAITKIASLYEQMADIDNSMKYFGEAKKLCLELDDKKRYAILSFNMAGLYVTKGDTDTAVKLCYEAISIARELNLKYYLCQFLNGMAQAMFTLGAAEDAKAINDEAMKISSEIENLQFPCTLLKNTIEATLGNNEEGKKKLLNMLTTYSNENEQAAINYSLWEATKEEKYKNTAKDMYKSLCEKTPHKEYKARLAELEML